MGEMTDDYDAYPHRVTMPSGLLMTVLETGLAARVPSHPHPNASTRRIADLTELYEEKLLALHRTRKFLERFPADDPNIDGDVLLISRRFPDGDTAYVYAAVRGGGVYHLTGGSPRTPQRIDWETLIDWLSSDPDCEIRKVTAVSGPFEWAAPVEPNGQPETADEPLPQAG